MAGLLRDIPKRAESIFEVLNGALEGLLGGLVQLLLVMPSTIAAILLGLTAWRGRRLVAGLVVVAGVHLLTFAGAWDQAVRTVAGGLTAAVIAAAVTGAAAIVSRRWDRLDAAGKAVRSLSLGPAIAIAIGVVLIALAPLLSGPTFAGWILVSGLIATTLLVAASDTAPHSHGPRRREWLWNALLAGCAARLLTEVITGEGLGGLARSSATGTDPMATVSAVLALVGFSAILVALPGSGTSSRVAPRGDPPAFAVGDEDGTPAPASGSRGAR